jgi:hypothetical protein
VPWRVLDLADEPALPDRRHRLVIARTDQHVAWRGDSAPADVDALLDRLSGRRPGAR